MASKRQGVRAVIVAGSRTQFAGQFFFLVVSNKTAAVIVMRGKCQTMKIRGKSSGRVRLSRPQLAVLNWTGREPRKESAAGEEKRNDARPMAESARLSARHALSRLAQSAFEGARLATRRRLAADIARTIANSWSMRRTISLAMLAPTRIRNLTYVKAVPK